MPFLDFAILYFLDTQGKRFRSTSIKKTNSLIHLAFPRQSCKGVGHEHDLASFEERAVLVAEKRFPHSQRLDSVLFF